MELKKVGWIGTGVMGKSMCGHIIEKGHETYVYNRTKEKTKPLVDKGAVYIGSVSEIAKKCDIVFTIVGFPHDVEETYFGNGGIIENIREGGVVVDMTTSTPNLAESIYAKAKDKGIFALDAPVSGGDIGAREAKLAIMVGGDENIFQAAMPFFSAMGQNIRLMGSCGKGQHTKMSNQILVAGNMIGAVESLLYAYKAGLDLTDVIEVIGKGAAASWTINQLGPRIAKNDFEPGFYIKHFIKDMGIALDECKRMKLSLPGLSLVNQFYIAASALGFENQGTQGLYNVLKVMNKVL